MKKRLSLSMILTVLVLTVSLTILPTGTTFAKIADGTYNVPFELKEAGNNNTSIADGYFSKPAKLTVENGVNYVQLTITNSEWVKSLSGPYGASTVVSDSPGNDSRTVKLQVGDLSQPVTMKMHVVVPEEVAGMKYDNHHTVRGIFNVSGIDSAGAGVGTTGGSTGESVENPPTGDSTPVALYVTLILSSIVVFTVYKFRFARN